MFFTTVFFCILVLFFFFFFFFVSMLLFFFFFFFSSRRRHTRSLCDWSSDVCSSDLEPGVFDFIEPGRPVSMEREVFPGLIAEGLTPYRFEGWWSDAGTLANYLNAQHLLLAAGRAKIASEADVTAGSLRPPVYVGAGSFVEGRLGPDVVLGKSCKVGRASVVNATLLEGVSVDDKVDIASSIIGAGAAIGEGAHVRDSILEDGVQVPPHAEVLDDRVAA